MKTYFIDGTLSGLIGRTSKDWDMESLYGDLAEDGEIDDSGRLMVSGRKAALATARDLAATHSPFTLADGEKYLISYQVLVCEDRGDGEAFYRIGGYERTVTA